MENEADIAIWQLKKGDDVLATLREEAQNFPWVYCVLETNPNFEKFRELFEFTGDTRRGKEAEIHNKIMTEGIGVFSADGERLRAFTLILDGETARLTFSEV